MRRHCAILALALTALAVGLPTSAHIGNRVYTIYEIRDDALAHIDLKDGDLADWRAVVGAPSLGVDDFHLDPTVGGEGPYTPADLSWSVWLGWHASTNRLYAAVDRRDDDYVNAYPGGDPTQMWEHDSVEFKVDGDHSGGAYAFTLDCCATEEERQNLHNRQAQHYFAIADSPDGIHIGNGGSAMSGPQWAAAPPFADAGGGSSGATLSVTEFYVTPFDDLARSGPGASRVSALHRGKVIGFEFNIIDHDVQGLEQEEVVFQNYYSLSGQPATWRYAERFVDGRLVGPPAPTDIEENSWARIKAAFQAGW